MIYRVLGCFVGAFLLVACQQEETKVYSFKGKAQGTTYSIKALTKKVSPHQKEIEQVLETVDLYFSNYREDSWISKFNAHQDTVPFVVYDDMELYADLFAYIEQVVAKTEGAFDPTVYPSVKKWGFGAKSDEGGESSDESNRVLHHWSDLKYWTEGDSFYLKKPDTLLQLDFNAVAQGFSVDLIARYLKHLRCRSYMVELGGELYCKGHKKNGAPWVIGIDHPEDNRAADRDVRTKIRVYNRAVATSGNYRKFIEKGGEIWGHTIDPKTGNPTKNSMLSVTVLAKDAALADAYATAFMVMGVEKTIELLDDEKQLDAYLIYRTTSGKDTTFATPNFEHLIIE